MYEDVSESEAPSCQQEEAAAPCWAEICHDKVRSSITFLCHTSNLLTSSAVHNQLLASTLLPAFKDSRPCEKIVMNKLEWDLVRKMGDVCATKLKSWSLPLKHLHWPGRLLERNIHFQPNILISIISSYMNI